jgi:hypothetical protein
MPSIQRTMWCGNVLRITGPADSVAQLRAQYIQDGELKLNKILPTPVGVDSDPGIQTHWRQEHWGTELDARFTRIQELQNLGYGQAGLVIGFNTTGGCIKEYVLTAIRIANPLLAFSYDGWDVVSHRRFHGRLVDGSVSYRSSEDYDPDYAEEDYPEDHVDDDEDVADEEEEGSDDPWEN